MLRKLFVFVLVSGLLLTGVWAFFHYAPSLQPPASVEVSPSVKELIQNNTQPAPSERPAEQPEPSKDPEPVDEAPTQEPQSVTIPAAFTLQVPFMSQAPSTNWELPFQEACEEASVVMVNRFYTKRPLPDAEGQDQIIVDMSAWGEEHMGAIDTDLATTSRYFTEYLSYDPKRVAVIYDITIDDIKAVIASGRPVIVPAAGRDLGNKYFRDPGPVYHMLVIVGYDRDEFITNDPGTRHGDGYRYDQGVLFDAIHDLTPDKEQIRQGRKAMMVVSP